MTPQFFLGGEGTEYAQNVVCTVGFSTVKYGAGIYYNTRNYRNNYMNGQNLVRKIAKHTCCTYVIKITNYQNNSQKFSFKVVLSKIIEGKKILRKG